MKRIVLHVGMHKTGTTSIQNTLYANRFDLYREGVVYPEFSDTGSNHSVALFSLYCEQPDQYHMNIKTGRSNRSSLETFHKATIAEFQRISLLPEGHKLVLSGEDLSVLSHASLTALRTDLKTWFPNAEISVVCSVRSPKTYWTSAVMEYVKNGMATTSLKDKLGVAGFYEDLIQKLQMVFCEDKVSFYKFEDSIQTSPVEYFLSHFVDRRLAISASLEPDNSSISQEAFILIKELNNIAPLFHDGELHKRRSPHDSHGLMTIKGAKCLNVGMDFDSEIQRDIRYLYEQLNINWEDNGLADPHPLWSIEVLQQIRCMLPDLTSFVRSSVLTSIEKHVSSEIWNRVLIKSN